MDIGLAMSAAQTAGAMAQAYVGHKAAKRVAEAQKETQALQLKYNKKELEKYIAEEYSNQMTNYINKRNNQLDEYNKMSSKLTMYATQNNSAIEGSSYEEDLSNQLDIEFQTNLQNLYAGMENSLSNVLGKKVSTEYELATGNLNAINQIDNTLRATDQKLMANVTDKLMGTAEKVQSSYSAFKKKDPEGSMGNFLSQSLYK